MRLGYEKELLPANVHPLFTKIIQEVIVTKLVRFCSLSWRKLTWLTSKDLFRRMKMRLKRHHHPGVFGVGDQLVFA